MRRIMLVLAVLWMSVRERWHMSRYNPWGAASWPARFRAGSDALKPLANDPETLLRVLRGSGEKPPNPPTPPVP